MPECQNDKSLWTGEGMRKTVTKDLNNTRATKKSNISDSDQTKKYTNKVLS